MTFRDVAAALKAAKQAGISVRRYEICKDRVVLIPGEPETGPEPKADDDAELDAAYRRQAEDYGKKI